jgi:hypothetical protein
VVLILLFLLENVTPVSNVLTIYINKNLDEQSFILGDRYSSDGYAELYGLGGGVTDTNYTGIITISKLTTTTISGTFNFKARKTGTLSEEINITNGHFDLSK